MFNLHRRTWAEVDLDAVEHNYDVIKKATNADICCVIKADAYGHGAVTLAKIYEQLGAKFFGVSNIEEALQLRNNGIKTSILIFGYTPAVDVSTLSQNNISQCVYSFEYAKELANECEKQNTKIKIHIKIDTGMSRLGFYFQDIQRDINSIKEIKAVCAMPYFISQGIFTHFAVSDEGTDDFTMKQLANFKECLNLLKDINFKIVHCANSGAIEDFALAHFDMVRAGIILYGLSPSTAMRNKLDLKPALSLKSVISHIKTIEKGSSVSYGRIFVADKKMRIATIPIGYADGYTRILAENNAEILINGTRCRVIGKICMDQLMVLVSDDMEIKIGQTVTLIGTEKNETISVEEIAKKRNTINYEVICDLGARVPRVYYKGGEAVDMLNYILPNR